jgi:hypothetical protein
MLEQPQHGGPDPRRNHASQQPEDESQHHSELGGAAQQSVDAGTGHLQVTGDMGRFHPGGVQLAHPGAVQLGRPTLVGACGFGLGDARSSMTSCSQVATPARTVSIRLLVGLRVSRRRRPWTASSGRYRVRFQDLHRRESSKASTFLAAINRRKIAESLSVLVIGLGGCQMPEQEGCHVPEFWGTDYPRLVYQAPVDNFSWSTGSPTNLMRLTRSPFHVRGTKCPNHSVRARGLP